MTKQDLLNLVTQSPYKVCYTREECEKFLNDPNAMMKYRKPVDLAYIEDVAHCIEEFVKVCYFGIPRH